MTEITIPKHGERFKVNMTESKTNDLVQRIYYLQNETARGLVELFQHPNAEGFNIPCRQCVLDVALLAHDLSEAIKELAEKK